MTTLGAFAPARAAGGLSSSFQRGERTAVCTKGCFKSPLLAQQRAPALPAGSQLRTAWRAHSSLRGISRHAFVVKSGFEGPTGNPEVMELQEGPCALPLWESGYGGLEPPGCVQLGIREEHSLLGPALAASVGLVLSLALCAPALALKVEDKKEAAAEGTPEEAAKKSKKKKKKKKKAKAKTEEVEGAEAAGTGVATAKQETSLSPQLRAGQGEGTEAAEPRKETSRQSSEAGAVPADPTASTRDSTTTATSIRGPRAGISLRRSPVRQGTEASSTVQKGTDSTAGSLAGSSNASDQAATSQQPETRAEGVATAPPTVLPVPAATPSPSPPTPAPAEVEPSQPAPAPVDAKAQSRQVEKKAGPADGGRSQKAGPASGGGEYVEVSERQEWVQGLPSVRETIPYTLVLDLQAQGNLKHIIKLPGSVLGARPELALAVLGDERVVRVVMPPADRDPQFWRAWGRQRLDSLLMDAFSPPTAPPQMLPWGTWGPSLKFLRDWGVVGRAPAPRGRAKPLPAKEGAQKAPPGKHTTQGAGVKKEAAGTRVKKAAGVKDEGAKEGEQKEGLRKDGVKREGPKKGAAAGAKSGAPAKKLSAKERAQAAAQARVRKLEEAARRAEQERRERGRALKQQLAERAAAEREERRRWEKEARERRKQEAQQKKSALASRKSSAQVATEGADSERWASFYKGAAENEGVRFLMGVGFFFVFYYGVILSIKKQRQDYADRVKLQAAAEEERRKMDSWEDEMVEIEAREADEEERRRAQGGAPASPEEEARDEQRKKEADSESMKAAMRFMRSGAKVKRARRGKRMRRPTYLDLSDEVRFDDVAGLGEIRRELEEIVDFFQSADKYRRRGSKIPTGILLCGEPGCGKTLLAKAVAGEAGVNFFSVSASQFVEIFVGVGASRVRALYNEAQENAPAVVFIDELDAVGRQRGLTEGSGGQERDATLNQLLTCLDGFEGRGDVITIAATNRPDILDTALVRPGRFDRKIFIPKPSLIGRSQILQVHSRNKVMAYDVDYEVVAEITDGMSGAELANVVDVAALKVLREGRTEITTDDLLEAAVLEEGGYRKAHPLSAKRQRQLALNEAAQAAVAYNYPEFRNIQLITVTPPITEEKGEIRFKMDSAKFKSHFLSVATLKAYITVQLAPMLADQMWNPPEEWCTIWADHVDLARKMARQLVINGLSAGSREGGLFEWSISRVQDPGRTDGVDREAAAILEECQRKAQELLTKNRGLVDALVERLEDVKTMQKDELASMVSMYGVYDEVPPPLEDVQGEVRRLREAYASSQG